MHIVGSSATAAISDDHGKRLVLQSISEPSADFVRNIDGCTWLYARVRIPRSVYLGDTAGHLSSLLCVGGPVLYPYRSEYRTGLPPLDATGPCLRYFDRKHGPYAEEVVLYLVAVCSAAYAKDALRSGRDGYVAAALILDGLREQRWIRLITEPSLPNCFIFFGCSSFGVR
jgi:hypothetical protein